MALSLIPLLSVFSVLQALIAASSGGMCTQWRLGMQGEQTAAGLGQPEYKAGKAVTGGRGERRAHLRTCAGVGCGLLEGPEGRSHDCRTLHGGGRVRTEKRGYYEVWGSTGAALKQMREKGWDTSRASRWGRA